MHGGPINTKTLISFESIFKLVLWITSCPVPSVGPEMPSLGCWHTYPHPVPSALHRLLHPFASWFPCAVRIHTFSFLHVTTFSSSSSFHVRWFSQRLGCRVPLRMRALEGRTAARVACPAAGVWTFWRVYENGSLIP